MMNLILILLLISIPFLMFYATYVAGAITYYLHVTRKCDYCTKHPDWTLFIVLILIESFLYAVGSVIINHIKI